MPASVPPPDRNAHDMSFEDFQDLYGPWSGLLPDAVASLLAGAPFPWWIAGGWAIDAATGSAREHEDTDVVVLARDVDDVRGALGRLHLWEAHETGALRPLRAGDTMLEGVEQFWVRENSRSPWILDVLLNPSDAADWLFKRDHSCRRPLDSIGWEANGVSYLRPEIVLLHKAKLSRAKDEVDLRRSLPHLDSDARKWLRAAIEATLPGHPWLADL